MLPSQDPETWIFSSVPKVLKTRLEEPPVSFWWRIRYSLFRHSPDKNPFSRYPPREEPKASLTNMKKIKRRKSFRFFSPVEYTRILIRWPAEIKMNYEEANPIFYHQIRSADNFTASKAAFRQPSEIKAVKRGGPLHHHIELSRAFLSNP